MLYQYIVWGLGALLLLLVIFRGWRSQMVREYRWFYRYITFVLAASVLRTVIFFTLGRSSSAYYYAYHIPSVLMMVLQLGVLIDLYFRIVGYTKTSWRAVGGMLILASVVTVPVASTLLTLEQSNVFVRSVAVGLSWQVVICLLICKQIAGKRKLVMGRNARGIFGGFGLLTAFQAMNFAEFLSNGAPLALFSFLVQFFYFLALVVFVWAMWDYDPIRQLEPAEEQQLNRLNRSVKEVVRALVLTR